MKDRRPDPKPRKHAHLWQAYLWFDEVQRMRIRHGNRLKAAEKGKSNFDATFEREIVEGMRLKYFEKQAAKLMINFGKDIGPVWDWLGGIPGIGQGRLAAQLCAQIDDIGKFATISKLWRYAGLAVINGRPERNQRGQKSKFNTSLKTICYNIVQEFIWHQTYPYYEIYYEEKKRQRGLHPDVMCKTCGRLWDDCPDRKHHKRMYNDGHLGRRARRKTAKIFLQHVWLVWCDLEGLPVSKPYAHDVLGHTHFIPPPPMPSPPDGDD